MYRDETEMVEKEVLKHNIVLAHVARAKRGVKSRGKVRCEA